MANKSFFAFYEPAHRLKTLSMKNKNYPLVLHGHLKYTFSDS